MISSDLSKGLDNNSNGEGVNAAMDENSKKKMIKREKKQQDAINKRKLLKQQQLTREIDMGIRNTKQFCRIWRQKMMEIKIPEMCINVEVAKNEFDHALDIKTYCCNLLLESLDKCDEQYQRNFNHHSQIIEKFETINQHRREIAYNFYTQNLNHSVSENQKESEQIELQKYEDELNCKAIIYQRKNEMDSIVDTVNDKNIDKLGNLRTTGYNVTKIAMVHMEKSILSIWDSLNTVLSKYLSDSEDKKLFYLSLKQKDDKNQMIIAQQLIRTADLMNSINKLRKQIAKLRDESKNRISENFLVECSILKKKENSIKKQFNHEQEVDKFQLNLLTTQYNSTVENLQHLTGRASTIMFLIRACRKFQMHTEKLLPIEIDKVNDEFDNLNFFWYQVGIADVMMKEYQRKKLMLREENNYLQKCLKEKLQEYR